MTTPLLVEQTGVAVIPPLHVSVVHHPPLFPVAAQQGVDQDLQAQTLTCETVSQPLVYAAQPAGDGL